MIYACDFETSVYDGQTSTEVWLAGVLSEDYKEKFVVNSLDKFMKIVFQLWKPVLYFHNLKFDGSFILDWLLNHGYKPAITTIKKEKHWTKTGEMLSKTFKCFISRKGQWYSIIIKRGRNIITIRDSLKLLPFPLAVLGKSLNLKHQKLTMEYKGYRRANGKIKPEELEYFEADLYVLMEALNAVKQYGIEGNTIGSCCLDWFKKNYGRKNYYADFPILHNVVMPDGTYGSPNVGEYITKSYYGAFVYVKPDKQNKIISNGITLDVTSLYPSRMHSESGVEYCYGLPAIAKGRADKKPHKYYYQRILVKFKLKKEKLPFLKIKNSYLYNPRECLEESKITLYDKWGIPATIDRPVELTLTQTELELMMEHYDIRYIKYLDYVQFNTKLGIFDSYIDYWLKIKNESDDNPVLRLIAKLMLNNLYGKFAASPLSSFKLPYYDDHPDYDRVRFLDVEEKESIPGYIAIGSAIISEARVFEIKHAQKNYNHFCYADTDSLHLDCKLEEVIDTEIAHNKLNTYKHESSWDKAYFDHAKRYIEHIVEEDGKPCEVHYSITCAGLPEHGKLLLRQSLGENVIQQGMINGKSITKEDIKFLLVKRKMNDFTKGFQVPGKLKTKRMKGGIVLEDGYFTIR